MSKVEPKFDGKLATLTPKGIQESLAHINKNISPYVCFLWKARTFVLYVHTMILLLLVRVADAPPKGVLVVSTDIPRKSLFLSKNETKEKQRKLEVYRGIRSI